MVHKRTAKKHGTPKNATKRAAKPAPAGRRSALLDTLIVYCGDCLDQLQKLADACVDLIYIEYTHPRCVELSRVLSKTGSFLLPLRVARILKHRFRENPAFGMIM